MHFILPSYLVFSVRKFDHKHSSLQDGLMQVFNSVTKDLEFVLTLMGLRCQAERARAIGALRLARHEGHDGRLVGHAPYVAHGPRNAIRTGSLIGRHLCSVYNHSSCYIRK